MSTYYMYMYIPQNRHVLFFIILQITFFWTLYAICVAPIEISSSFMGLIRSAT